MSTHHETRLAIEEYRRRRKAVRNLTDVIARIRERLSHAEEAAAEAEYDAAILVLEHGPQEIDGRRYEHELHSEYGTHSNRLIVSPVDAFLMVGYQNAPEIMP